MTLRDFKTAQERRKYLQEKLCIQLDSIQNSSLEAHPKVHCENLIGATSVPLGVAGPLKIHGEAARGEFFIPLATTEGALVASVNRGAKAISESGGTFVYAFKVGTTRGPVFFTGTLQKSRKLYKYIKEHEKDLIKIAEKTSSHLKLKKIMVKGLADYVFVRFSFDTSDAMGMNMVTIATAAVVQKIEKDTGISCLSVAGNFDIDKKAAWLNFIENRGYKIWAEVSIKEKVLKDVLKTSAEKLFNVWLGKNMLGSAMSGSLGYNAHFANIIASLFIATGQDAAHVVEGSMGITTARVENKDLYFSIYLPSIMIGTVGGGTILPTQQEALKIIFRNNSYTAIQFAEIVGGAVVAGELSLLASLAEGTLARAHKKLGR